MLATVLYPVQWVALRPVLVAREAGSYFENLKSAQAGEDAADHGGNHEKDKTTLHAQPPLFSMVGESGP